MYFNNFHRGGVAIFSFYENTEHYTSFLKIKGIIKLFSCLVVPITAAGLQGE